MPITTMVGPDMFPPIVSKPASAVPVPSPEPTGGSTPPTTGQIWPRGNRS